MCRNAIQDANLYLYLIKQKHLSYPNKKSIKLIKIIQTYVLFCFCSKFFSFFLSKTEREVCTTKINNRI